MGVINNSFCCVESSYIENKFLSIILRMNNIVYQSNIDYYKIKVLFENNFISSIKKRIKLNSSLLNKYFSIKIKNKEKALNNERKTLSCYGNKTNDCIFYKEDVQKLIKLIFQEKSEFVDEVSSILVDFLTIKFDFSNFFLFGKKINSFKNENDLNSENECKEKILNSNNNLESNFVDLDDKEDLIKLISQDKYEENEFKQLINENNDYFGYYISFYNFKFELNHKKMQYFENKKKLVFNYNNDDYCINKKILTVKNNSINEKSESYSIYYFDSKSCGYKSDINVKSSHKLSGLSEGHLNNSSEYNENELLDKLIENIMNALTFKFLITFYSFFNNIERPLILLDILSLVNLNLEVGNMKKIIFIYLRNVIFTNSTLFLVSLQQKIFKKCLGNEIDNDLFYEGKTFLKNYYLMKKKLLISFTNNF